MMPVYFSLRCFVIASAFRVIRISITLREQLTYQDEKLLSIKLLLFSYPPVITFVLGAQKNRLSETVLFSTHNICFS